MMNIIKCPAIEKPTSAFTCEVIRQGSNMRYQDPSDGTWKPIYAQQQETWKVLAETVEGATKIANYHFYSSTIISVK